jgi:multidrug efflux pump subunit AcrA (membrane-fusion protein)
MQHGNRQGGALDAAAKIISVALVAGFIGLSAWNAFAPKKAPATVGEARGAAGGRRQSGGAQDAGGQADGTVTVSALTLEPGTIRQSVKLNGDVSPLSEVSLYPDAAGRIARVLKRLGDPVRAGDVVAYIDPSKPGTVYAESPVRATVAGTITSLSANAGDTASLQTVIASVGSLDRLKITVYVAEKYSTYLREGLPAFASFAFAPSETFEATVTSVSPVVNGKNRTVEASLALKERDARIRQGMFAQVSLVIREERDALVVPRAAVKDYNGEAAAYVIDGDTARRVRVSVGLMNDAEAQIVSGLKAGERVITAGAVADGSPVRIVKQ